MECGGTAGRTGLSEDHKDSMKLLDTLFKTGLDPLEVDVPTTVAALSDGVTQIIDCREPNEWSSGHIDGSVLVPLGSLGPRIGELDPSRPVIVVCRSGRRSLIAAKQLTASGFADAKSLNGGVVAWVQQGQTLVS